MAQIALRKTTEKNELDYPEAAVVLSKTSFMDDICGSVDTVAQAQTLTEDLDKVLESGGFGVKGWTSNKILAKTEDQKRGSRCSRKTLKKRCLG